MQNDFLSYLEEWENDVRNRPSLHGKPYTADEMKKMLLSQETLMGLRLTTKSILELVPFMLSKGAQFIFTRPLNQDPIEHLFSRHRQACGSGQNPTAFQFYNNSEKLRILKEGNVKIKTSGANTNSV